MRDPNLVDRRLKDRRKSIPLSLPATAFATTSRFLVIPEDLTQDFPLCTVAVDSLSGHGAWLKPIENSEAPPHDHLMLIEFKDEWVLTHHTEVLKREGSRVLVDAASLTERERSQLAPSTGRHDYRVDVNLPVRIKAKAHDDTQEAADSPKLARLVNLSRGGMALLAPLSQVYETGEVVTVRVVSWNHSVQIDALVARIDPPTAEEERQRLALQFHNDMNVKQRESITTFILQVQRREALGRALPTNTEESA